MSEGGGQWGSRRSNNDYCTFSAQSKSEKAATTGTRTLGNQVIRKGHMCIQNLGIMKGNLEVARSGVSLSNPI